MAFALVPSMLMAGFAAWRPDLPEATRAAVLTLMSLFVCQSPAPSPGGLGDDEDDTDGEVDEQYLARMARATRRLAVRLRCPAEGHL